MKNTIALLLTIVLTQTGCSARAQKVVEQTNTTTTTTTTNACPETFIEAGQENVMERQFHFGIYNHDRDIRTQHLVAIGNAFDQYVDYRQAFFWYAKAFAESPDSADVCMFMGETMAHLYSQTHKERDGKMAMESFNMALELDEMPIEAPFHLSMTSEHRVICDLATLKNGYEVPRRND